MRTGFKLVFVDDERYVREQICTSMDWESLGIELIGNCDNAVDALDLIVDEVPDILVTDIKMPVVNGLELIEKAKQMNPSLQCIILSGYAEFSLAQAAIEQGVKYYLLKPFSGVELEKILQSCCEQIIKERTEWAIPMERRSRVILHLAQELQNMKESGAQLTEDAIRELLEFYPDASLLREAVILLIARHPQGQYIDRSANEISRLFEESEDMLAHVAELLNRLPNETKSESELVSSIKSYTKKHYGDANLNLQFIAEEVVHLSVKYIGRCFLKETGVRYSRYLLQVRMEKAKRMLRQTEKYPVEKIAEEIGLGHDIPYFYQLFKKYTGITPREYQKGPKD